METTMNTRHNWIFGLAGLGLVMAVPVQAAPDFPGDVIIVAKRDQADDARPDSRDGRKDKGGRRESKREVESEEPQGYGYGYERRQRSGSGDDGRSRGRR